MTVYFGLPLTCDEAVRILGLNINTIINDIKIKHECVGNYRDIHDIHITEELNEYFRVSTKIRIFYTDKGQCIIGYEIEELSDLWKKIINADEFVIKIVTLKTQFTKEMEILKADLSQVTLEHMEAEPEIIKNPIPYVIAFNG
jgi:hypothetical protein